MEIKKKRDGLFAVVNMFGQVVKCFGSFDEAFDYLKSIEF